MGPAFGYAQPDACVLHLLPFCGTYGCMQTMAALYCGAPMVVHHTFEPASTARLLREQRITLMGCTDELIQYFWPDLA